MLETDEPEILDGTRAWSKTQQLFHGVIDPGRRRFATEATWYDTSLNEHVGAFCVVQAGGIMEELIGDFVRFSWRNKEQFLYCVGGAEIPTEFAVSRLAWLHLTEMSIDRVQCGVQALVRE